MRLRNVKGSQEYVNNHQLVLNEPKNMRGKWHSFFDNQQPIHIEIGMGKGDFIIGMAEKHPHINFIGIEKMSGVMLRAVKKLEIRETPIDNLCLCRMDANDLEEVFESNEIDQIYLNFSDPWPKERKSKHRLTYRGYLKAYSRVLKPEAMLQFKSDNDHLFAFSLEELETSTFELLQSSDDLHHSPYVEGNVMTEYETKFVAKGKNINYFLAKNMK